MGYHNNSKESEIRQMIELSVFLLFVLYIVIRVVNSNIESVFDILSNVWTWMLVILFCLIVSGILVFFFRKKNTKIKGELFESINEGRILKIEIANLKECITSKDLFYDSMIKFGDLPVKHLTELITDFKLVQYDISSKFLKIKKHPARSEALRIDELKRETKIYYEQYKQMLYKYEALLGLFPELAMYVEDFESIKELNDFISINNLKENYDRVRDYTTTEEYNKLSTDGKNQLALNRYVNGRKSKWQIGRDYEMYIAYIYRSNGWFVEQFGIEKKLEDMGRDLIVFNQNKILIVQCKYWSESKLIHEKHIAQLYGSTIEYAA